MRARTMLIGALLLAVAGCSVVTPSDRAVIHDHRLNAVAINERVQADTELPHYVRVWWAAEADTWIAMDAWAAGEKFPEAPATRPAEGTD